MKKLSIILCILPLLLHCGPKQEKLERTIVDGVEVVINQLKPYKTDGPKSLILKEILSIDTEDAVIEDLGIPDIFGFDVNSLGEIYILRNIQGVGDFVFKFDAEGKFIKSFGPSGQGPGELQNPHHIAIDHDDNIFIFDLGPQILHKYDKNGILIGDYNMLSGENRVAAGPNENLLAFLASSVSDNDRRLNTYFLKLLNPDLGVLQVIDEFSFE